jgi:hypothetical protein
VGQFVVRGVPFSRICELPVIVLGAKLRPFTVNAKLCCALARTLDGSKVSIVGPDVMATVAEAVSAGFAALVAVMRIALGDGAADGAM